MVFFKNKIIKATEMKVITRKFEVYLDSARQDLFCINIDD